MKRLKRACWLAAWGVWVWLGFGLYHQLPRDLGPAVRRLPVAVGDRVLGFVGQTNIVAILAPVTEPLLTTTIPLFDAESGANVGRRPETRFALHASLIIGDPLTRSLRIGAIIGPQPMDATSNTDRTPGAHRLNLLTGEWLDLSKRLLLGWSLHPREPWLAHLERENGKRPPRMVVYDYMADREIFTHDMPAGTKFNGRPYFIADRNAVVVSIHPRNRQANAAPLGLAMWTYGTQPAFEELPLSAPLTDRFSNERVFVADNGRILFGGRSDRSDDATPDWVDVFDVVSKQFLTSFPPDDQAKQPSTRKGISLMDPTGATVLRGTPPALFKVGSGRVRWQAKSLETIESWDDHGGFTLAERWDGLWRAWFKGFKVETRVRRSLTTGEVLIRTPGDAIIEPRNINAAETLVVLNDGTVRRWPLSRNWSLLALCQAILALPLVLLWTILRRRRRRRSRLTASSP